MITQLTDSCRIFCTTVFLTLGVLILLSGTAHAKSWSDYLRYHNHSINRTDFKTAKTYCESMNMKLPSVRDWLTYTHHYGGKKLVESKFRGKIAVDEIGNMLQKFRDESDEMYRKGYFELGFPPVPRRDSRLGWVDLYYSTDDYVSPHPELGDNSLWLEDGRCWNFRLIGYPDRSDRRYNAVRCVQK